MSYLCYSLDEAAKQLGMSETVLFRLSQFLKIPANAYDDVGYIAFNGDLSFNDSDLAFFKQVKERLLKGETLETIKQRIKTALPTHSQSAAHSLSAEIDAQSSTVAVSEAPEGALNTIETVSHLKKEATKTFNRYKVQARPRLNQVFQNLAQQISDNLKQNVLQTSSKPTVSTENLLNNIPTVPLWHPETIQNSTIQGKNSHGQDPGQATYSIAASTPPMIKTETNAQYPWKTQAEPQKEASPINVSWQNEAVIQSQPTLEPDFDSPWTDIIQAANQSPRSLNVRLRAAAQTLRQKALYQIQRTDGTDA